MKEILKQIKVGHDPQKGFTQVDKDRDVRDGIRGSDALEPPSNKEGHERNQKRENRGPEEHEE